MKKPRKTIILALLLIGGTVPYFVCDGERKALEAADRADLPGKTAKLSLGATYYERGGPSSGKPVILVHGLTIPSYLWETTFEGLVGAGFNVVRYDLYGRGFSDRPDATYGPDLFEEQLGELIEELKLEEPAHLVGLSLGGAISVNFAAKHSEKVDRLVLVAPYYRQEQPVVAKLMNAPLLGDYLMKVLGDRILIKRLPEYYYKPLDYPQLEQRFLRQLEFVGYKKALLSTLRHYLPLDLTDSYSEVGHQERPVLLLWGKHDRVIPLANSAAVLEVLPQAKLHQIDAGHVPLQEERSEECNELIISFLKGATPEL